MPASASFVGAPWVASGGIDVPGWEAFAPSATFAEGTVAGSTGCNRFTAGFTLDGDTLRIGTIAATKMACAPPADEVERVYLDALGRVSGWRTDGADLVLVDDGGAAVLRYRPATPLGKWKANALQTGTALASPLPGTEIAAHFGEAGSLTGYAGCNTYRTTYKTDGGNIRIAPPAATKKMCAAPEGVMEQEAAYLAALPEAKSWRVDADSLALLRDDGTYVVSYARAPEASPAG